jgi:hypothetical protein
MTTVDSVANKDSLVASDAEAAALIEVSVPEVSVLTGAPVG